MANVCPPPLSPAWEQLPVEIVDHICHYLPAKALAQLSAVCKAWQDVAYNSFQWKAFCLQKQWKKEDETLTWYKFYISQVKWTAAFIKGKILFSNPELKSVHFDLLENCTQVAGRWAFGQLKESNQPVLGLVDLETKRCTWEFKVKNKFIFKLAALCKSYLAIYISRKNNKKGVIKLYYQDGRPNAVIHLELSAQHLACSPQWCVTSCRKSFYDLITVFDSNGRLYTELQTNSCITTLSIHNNLILAGDINGTFQLWDLQHKKKVGTLQFRKGCQVLFFNDYLVSYTIRQIHSEFTVVSFLQQKMNKKVFEITDAVSCATGQGDILAIKFEDQPGVSLYNLKTGQHTHLIFTKKIERVFQKKCYDKMSWDFDKKILYILRADKVLETLNFENVGSKIFHLPRTSSS
jgi:hypothetical protein